MAVGDSKYPLPKLPSTVQFENPKTYDDLFRLFNSFRELVRVIDAQGFITDAPIDGVTYGRKDGAWDPVTGGVPEAPLDGQQYGRQSGAWTVISGGGGGGNFYHYPIDVPPTSPDPWNDEFDGSSLNTSKWTEAKPAVVVSQVSESAYNLQWNSTSADTSIRFGGIHQPITTGTYLICIDRAGPDYAYQGPMIAIGNAASNQFFAVLCTYHGGYGGTGAMYTLTSNNIMNSATTSENNLGKHLTYNRVYWKVEITSTTITYYVSSTGSVWSMVVSVTISSVMSDAGRLWLGGQWYSTNGAQSALSVQFARKIA